MKVRGAKTLTVQSIVLGVLACALFSVYFLSGRPITAHAAMASRGDHLDSWRLSNPLIVPWPAAFEGEQLLALENIRRESPSAYFARWQSRLRFSHLSPNAVAQVARRSFPVLIGASDGGAPKLPRGDRLLRYSSPDVAQLSLPGHRRAVMESLGTPMAVRGASGRLESVDLALKRVGSSFVPDRSPVAVAIPRRLASGVRAGGSGVSLVPVNSAGKALGGSQGSMQGASVLFANTEDDSDTVVKPTGRGFELSVILRSIYSPHRLYYRVKLPAGARLVQHQARSPVEVVSGGEVLGMVMPPSAEDAAGTSVPVTMRARGDLLSVDVDDTSGEYQWPLEVDPEYDTSEDRSLTGGVFPVEEYTGGTNWEPYHSAGFSEEETYTKSYSCGPEDWGWCEQSWHIAPAREFNPGEVAGLRYKTQGESTIYNLEMWLEGENEPSQTASEVEYRYGPNEEGQDNHVVLSSGINQTRYKYEPLSMTSGYFHNPLETPRGNAVRFVDETTKHESPYSFWAEIWAARVYVAQEESKHPEAEPTSACPQCGFNNSSSTITTKAGSRANVLYGSGSWLSPYQGAYEVTVHDPGVGISYAAVDGAGMSVEWFLRDEESLCDGIQCPETVSKQVTYNPTMANGDDSIELFGEDAAGLYGYSYEKIKVDASKPYGLGFTGMPEEGAEISAAPHKLTVHATDGKKPTPSSGIRSVSVSIDGGTPTELSGASCPEGECTASGEYVLHAEDLSEGVHSLVVYAVSNSSVSAAEEFVFDVRHATPVSVGPGEVDPTTGQLTLTASDVSLGGTGVSRSYESRDLSAGASGPFGPQWAMSVGGGEGLTVLPSGSVVLTSSSGGQTMFALNAKGELEAPKGDENLKIEYKTSEHKYILKDAKAGSETVFEQPAGTQSTPPTFGAEFGAEAGVLSRPIGETLDAKGDLWVADGTDDRIVEFSKSGTLVATYGSAGSEADEFDWPAGIAINQTTGNVYVADVYNHRIDELSSSGAFIRAFGWGVANGEAKLETCTSSCKAGIAGTGNGQLYYPHGMTIDSSGNLWVTEEVNDRVQEFSETGEYAGQFGSSGAGSGEFGDPTSITIAGGNFFVADQTDNRIAEFSTGGSFIKAFGWGVSNGEAKLETCTSSCEAGIVGSGNGQFDGVRGITTDPVSGNLYVAETSNDRVQEFTSGGAFVTMFGSGGSGVGQFANPREVVVSSTGAIYVSDYEHARIQEWMRATWWPTSAKGAVAAHTTYIYAPVENSAGTTTMQPDEVISPPSNGVECGTKPEELKNGCHALTFKYATEKTAKGEGPSEWGSYKGRLEKVMYHTYSGGKPVEEAVAEYSYDTQGRLRAEWDPRVEKSTGCGGQCTALKTTYGYDAEGLVTALTPAGEQPWIFTYGTIVGDAGVGRLLKVSRGYPKARESAEEVRHKLAEEREAPTVSEAPKLSGTPAVGVRMSVSNGMWGHSPVVYGYEWEDCNSGGKECTVIAGADNENYMPVSGDVGHTLVAVVTAVNGGGSTSDASAASAVVLSRAGMIQQTVDGGRSLGAVGCVPGTSDCAIGDASGATLYATNITSSSEASWKAWSGPETGASDALACPSSSACVLAVDGDVYSATSLGGPWKEVFSPSYPVDALSCASASFCIDGQAGSGGYIRYSASPISGTWMAEDIGGSNNITGVSCVSSSFCVAVDGSGKLYVANSTGEVESSIWTTSTIDGTSKLDGVACTSTSSCVAVDGSGNAIKLSIESSGSASASKHDIDASNDLSAVSCSEGSTCVAVDTAGNVFSSKNAGETWSEIYTLGDDLSSVSCASGSLCTTVDSTGHVTSFNPAGGAGTEGEYHAPQPGSTIEYRVPVSGEGAPHDMSPEEVEKWGQKDKGEQEDNDPVEATAVFAPDEPQGWPASSYQRATIDYMNAKGLTVNSATPSGAISTSEYNEFNETVRTLSAENRVTALGEGCESVKEDKCKSEEVSRKLDTKTEYGAYGSQIKTITGPEHTVKLSSGEEVKARAVTHNYYNEGAEEAEEKNKETYNLITKSTSGALLANGEEKDVRTSITSYSGQDDLGWKLRKPTSVTTDPRGLDLTRTTEYSEATGDVVESKAPGGTSTTVSPPVFSGSFGSWGYGGGEFEDPVADAVDGSGDVWVVDQHNDRVEKFSSTGVFIAAYGSGGSGLGEFSDPLGVAVDLATGDVFVSDAGNNRIEELSGSGEFLAVIGWGVSDGKSELEVCKASCRAGLSGAGDGELDGPSGLTVDARGDVWVADLGNDRVQEFSAAGGYLSQFGSKGTGDGQFSEPDAVAISEGELYVADCAQDRVQEFSPSGSYLGQFGSDGEDSGQLRCPEGIAVNQTTGDLYVADTANQRVEQFSPAGKYLTEFGVEGSGDGQFKNAVGVAVNASGTIYAVDEYNSRVQEWQPPGTAGTHMSYWTQFGTPGAGDGQFNYAEFDAVDGEGDVWVTSYDSSRIEEFAAQGKFIASYGSEGTGEGQFKHPTGIAVNQATGDVYVADCENDRIEELSSSGSYIRAFGSPGAEHGQLSCPQGVKIDSSGDVWVADQGNDRIQEFSATGTFIAAYGSEGSGNGQFKDPTDLAFSGSDIYVVDSGNDRVQELSDSGSYIRAFGSEGDGGGQLENPQAITADSTGDLYVLDAGNDRIQEFNASGTYLDAFGSYGTGNEQLSNPQGIAINPAGDLYVADGNNNRVEVWAPSQQAAHDTKTSYYTAKEEATVPACRNHPEWAGLVCQSEPAAQPETEGLPALPVDTVTAYNIWDDAETTIEKFGSTSRTKTETYDPAGRALSSEETASPATDQALPKTTVEYNAETGSVEKQSATIKGETKTITSRYNTLGQLTEYADAEGNVAKYAYEEGSDGRLEEESEGKGKEAESKQTYSYDPTTGFMTKLVDSAAGTFTASYNAEGQMTSEIYPNGMCANTAYNQTGQAVSLQYIKTRNCTEKEAPVWFSDAITPGVHGETLTQTSTLSKEDYAYDNDGRLLETQETPAGKDCVSRLYAYDEEGDRTSETTREAASETCASEGGTTERHTYDPADRLTDEGITYETFGNITAMPAADAGGHELTTSYYLDNQVYTQKQNGETLTYIYDPAGRTLETNSEGKTSAKTISHYSGPGEAITWTSEGTEKWARNIPGIGGGLCATQKSGESPVLQLSDLQGNIVATAAISESETKLLTTYNSTEFGVPQPGSTPPKYAWLGAGGVFTEKAMESGVATQGGASYVPQVARALQTAPVVPPGAFPDGQPGTPYEGATISPIGLKIAEDKAIETWQHTEAERQKAKQEEEAEELQKCQEEGGCGAEYDPNCTLSIELAGNGHGVVTAVGTASCGGEILPRYSELEVCLFDELENGELYDAGVEYCGADGSGFNPEKPSQSIGLKGSLSAGRSAPCQAESIYYGWAWFWMPGERKPAKYSWTSSWRCGQSVVTEIINWAEWLTGLPDGGGDD